MKDINVKETNKKNFEKEEQLRDALLNCDLFTFEKARNEYIMSLEPLIKKYAYKYAAQSKGILTAEDYINEAFVRVMEKFDTFNFRKKDIRLSTFMTWHIVDAMQILKASTEQAYACNGSNIKLLKPIKEYLKEEPNATFDDIANKFGISKSRAMAILDSEKQSVSVFKSNDDDSQTLLEGFSSNMKNSEEICILEKSLEDLNVELKKVLTDVEFDVIECSMGLNDSEQQTLLKISERYNCTKENIRQIKERALKKIREAQNRQVITDLLMTISKLKSI